MRTAGGDNKGFGFVTMANDQEAVRAILKLNKSTYNNRVIEVRFKLKVGSLLLINRSDVDVLL